MIIIARLLGPAGVGQVAYLIWVAAITVTLTNLGLPYSLTRYLAELHGQHQAELAASLTRWIFLRYLGLVLLGTAFIGLVGGYAQTSVLSEAWLLLCVLFFLQGFGDLYQAHLSGRQRFDLSARVNIVCTFLLVSGVAIGTYFFGPKGALGGYIAGTAIPALLGLSVLLRRTPRVPLPRKLCSRLWRYASFTWLFYILASFSWSRLEIFFLEQYWDIQQVALFAVSLSLATLATQGPLMFLGALMPHFAERMGAKDIETIRRLYASATRLIAFLLFPLCLGCAAVTPVLLPLLYGKAFIAAVPTAMVVVGFSALTLAYVGQDLLFGLERPHFMALSGVTCAALALLAYLILIPPWGAWGAAWARSITQGSLFCLLTWYIVRRLAYPVPLRALGRCLVSAVLCALAAYGPVAYLPAFYGLALGVPLGAAVYLLCIRILRVLEPGDIEALMRAVQRGAGFTEGRATALVRWVGGTP